MQLFLMMDLNTHFDANQFLAIHTLGYFLMQLSLLIFEEFSFEACNKDYYINLKYNLL